MPILITRKQYRQTIDIIRGKKSLNPVFRELKEWYAEESGLETYNFIIEKNICFGKRRLMYLSNGDLYEYRKPREKAFIQFRALCKKYHMYQRIKWEYEFVGGYDFNPIWWCETISAFSREAIPEIERRYAHAHLDMVIDSGCGVITIFFEKDADIVENRENGICAAIQSNLTDMFAQTPVDEQLRLKNMGQYLADFSSRETLDRDYDGNLYYFYK